MTHRQKLDFLEEKFSCVSSELKRIWHDKYFELLCLSGAVVGGAIGGVYIQNKIAGCGCSASKQTRHFMLRTLFWTLKLPLLPLKLLPLKKIKKGIKTGTPFVVSSLSSVGVYKLVCFLIRKQRVLYKNALLNFVKNWQLHRTKTPQEFYQLFDNLYQMYLHNDGALGITEMNAVEVVNAIIKDIKEYKKYS